MAGKDRVTTAACFKPERRGLRDGAAATHAAARRMIGGIYKPADQFATINLTHHASVSRPQPRFASAAV